MAAFPNITRAAAARRGRSAPRVAAVDADHGPLVMPAFRRLDREAAFEQAMALQSAALGLDVG